VVSILCDWVIRQPIFKQRRITRMVVENDVEAQITSQNQIFTLSHSCKQNTHLWQSPKKKLARSRDVYDL
jgi:hypothetical protein